MYFICFWCKLIDENDYWCMVTNRKSFNSKVDKIVFQQSTRDKNVSMFNHNVTFIPAFKIFNAFMSTIMFTSAVVIPLHTIPFT